MALPGTMELVVIMLVALLIFGPKRMPEIGRSVARALREITRIKQELLGQITSIDDDPVDDPYKRKDDPV
ncbi:MAG: twin-arginine translocase TatA/TatE family subunit [Armatimonadota bacterium]